MNMKYSNRKQQRGVALVVSLIILVSLTMLGLTSIQRTTNDLSMAGNQRETGLMFQAAEVGLTAAENYIENVSTSVADFDNPGDGLITVPATDTSYTNPDYFDEATWSASSTQLLTSLEVKEQPRYMIEYLGERCNNCPALLAIGGGYGGQPAGERVDIYRSTARGVGLTGNFARYVQSYWGKEKK